MSEIKLSENELKCLKALFEINGEDYFDEEMGWSRFKHIAQITGFTEQKARIFIRALKRKGMAQYSQLFNGDGFVSGSGYHITKDGFNYIKELTPSKGER